MPTEYKQCHKCGEIVLLADGDEVCGTNFWACNRCLDKIEGNVGPDQDQLPHYDEVRE